MVKITIKQDSFNCSLSYPQKAGGIINSAQAEAKAILKKYDYDYILIVTYFLAKGVDGLRLHLKNDYARQLKSEIKKVLKIKK